MAGGAGKRINKALRDGPVSIHAAVAQKGPVATRLLNQRAIDLAQHDIFSIVAGLRDDAAERIGKKAAAPEFEARPRSAIAKNIAMLDTDAIDGGHVDAVGDGVRALDGAPRIILRFAKFVFLRRVPANCSGIKKYLGALQRGEPRAFGIPLVPANQRAQRPRRIDCLKAKIARREIVFLVIERIVGNMHLAVDAGDLAVGVKSDCGVVVKPGRAALEERCNYGDVRLPCSVGQFGSRWTRNRLGEVKERELFALAKILRAEKLRQADDLCAQLCSLANMLERRPRSSPRDQRPSASAPAQP